MKNNKRKKLLVYIYNSFADPLFQGLLFRYIKDIVTQKDEYEFHIITFEQPAYEVKESKKEEIKQELAKNYIFWYPQTFHTGRFLLFKKAYDLLQALKTVWYIKRKHKPTSIFAFANIAASYSYLLSKLFHWKIIVFSYEPHSDFLMELGYWSKNSLKYRILNSLERRVGLKGDYIITGTKHMIQHLKERGSKAKLYRLPTSVDHQLFKFNPAYRSIIRRRLSIEDRKVVIYTGKFGDLYYKEEIFELYRTLYEKSSGFYFIILTGHDKEELMNLFKQYGIPTTAYYIDRVPFEEVTQYLSAADVGLVTVANFPSKKFCSPTKVGEYLCCGLPYIVTKGTSEDDLYAAKHNVGVVVESFLAKDVLNKYDGIIELLEENLQQQRQRCRKVGIEYRGLDNAVATITEVLEDCYSG